MKIKLFNLLLTLAVFIASGCNSSNTYSSSTASDSSAVSGPSAVAVNGTFLQQSKLEDLVVAAYGKKVLDDMVSLELAKQYAASKGISLTDQMYQQQYENLLNEIAPGKPEADQEAIFEFMLKKRKITRDIFDLILKKQALLQASVDQDIEITDQMLNDEFQRQYGQKRTIRLIKVNSVRQMDKVELELAGGANFTEVAIANSVDELSLRSDALAGPVSIADDYYPASVISHAFSLEKTGDISSSFMVADQSQQNWYKLKLESIIPALETDINPFLPELRKIITKKEITKRMLALQDQLNKKARIIIMDKRLK